MSYKELFNATCDSMSQLCSKRTDLSHVSRAAERTRGARGKILFGPPMMSLFSNNKTKNQWTVLQSVDNTSKRGL